MKTVAHFNASNDIIRYSWPYYLPTDEIAPFFKPAKDSILEILKNNTVLESCGHKLAEASQLYYVDPDKFADEDGQPFTLCSQTAESYLSSKYPSWAIGSIVSLGVQKLSDKHFLNDLELMIFQHQAHFRDQSSRWHAQLAKVLLPLTIDLDLLQIMKKLRIVPLSTGEWSASDDKPAFFKGALPSLLPDCRSACHQDTREDSQPWKLIEPKSPQMRSGSILRRLYDDIDLSLSATFESRISDKKTKLQFNDFPFNSGLLIVDPVASADETRYNLYERLGIKDLSPSEMCQQLSDCHASPSFKPEQWSKSQLVSHAKFVYEAHWRPSRDVDLWFATSDDKRCKGSRLYLPSSFDQDSSAARVSQKLTAKYPTIHSDYFADSDEAWIVYLQEGLRLSAIPRLVIPAAVTSNQSFSLSTEFVYLFRECNIADIVQILNDNWHIYSFWLEPDTTHQPGSAFSKSRVRLLDDIKRTAVQTRNGGFPLSETVFPNIDTFMEEQLPLPVLDIENSKSKLLRQRLCAFGVFVEADINYYLFCLRRLNTSSSPAHEILCHIYEQIQSRYDGNEDYVEYVENLSLLIFHADTCKVCLPGRRAHIFDSETI